MNINDPVTYCLHTDCDAGWVTKVSASGKTIEVEFAKATLLNGVNSGEPDALQCSPGGYCGHISGVQRWKLERNPDSKRVKFTQRKNGKWKIAGHPSNSPGCELVSGHHHYLDFNF